MVTNFPLCAVSVPWSSVEFCDRFHGLSETVVRVASVVVAELRKSMSVLTDPEGNQTGFPDGTEEVRRNHGETGDNYQRNDGRRRTDDTE